LARVSAIISVRGLWAKAISKNKYMTYAIDIRDVCIYLFSTHTPRM
jgi:hypothetical protein